MMWRELLSERLLERNTQSGQWNTLKQKTSSTFEQQRAFWMPFYHSLSTLSLSPTWSRQEFSLACCRDWFWALLHLCCSMGTPCRSRDQLGSLTSATLLHCQGRCQMHRSKAKGRLGSDTKKKEGASFVCVVQLLSVFAQRTPLRLELGLR